MLQERAWKLIKPDPALINTKDDNHTPINKLGVSSLAVNIGGRVEVMKFKVVERLAVPVIISCEYCDENVEVIKPRQRIVQLGDGTTVRIFRKPPPRR